MKTRCACLFAAVAAVAIINSLTPSPVSAPADIIGVSGSARVHTDPASVARDIWESNRRTRVFEEQMGLSLEGPLHVDITGRGRVDDDSLMSPGDIESGTLINSYFVHQDPVGPKGALLLKGSITFAEVILGVIIDRATLMNSDAALGNPSTEYPEGLFPRGLDFRQPLEFIKISKDGHKLKYRFYTTTAMDQIRIITDATPLPGPGCAALLVGGLLAMNRRRRRFGAAAN